jgi:hypothetical protein
MMMVRSGSQSANIVVILPGWMAKIDQIVGLIPGIALAELGSDLSDNYRPLTPGGEHTDCGSVFPLTPSRRNRRQRKRTMRCGQMGRATLEKGDQSSTTSKHSSSLMYTST